ncbi:hypothetical protein ACOME3_010599, partial [Neoechinorhynchus agilis]
SIPAPCYYAHHVAFRARHYVEFLQLCDPTVRDYFYEDDLVVKNGDEKFNQSPHNNIKEKSLVELGIELRNMINIGINNANWMYARANIGEFMRRPITANEIRESGILEIIDEMMNEKGSEKITRSLKKIKYRLQVILKRDDWPSNLSKTDEAFEREMDASSQINGEVEQKAPIESGKTAVYIGEGRWIERYSTAVSSSLKSLRKRLHCGLNEQFAVTNTAWVRQILAKIILRNTTKAEIEESGIVEVIEKMAKNESDEATSKIIKEVLIKLKQLCRKAEKKKECDFTKDATKSRKRKLIIPEDFFVREAKVQSEKKPRSTNDKSSSNKRTKKSREKIEVNAEMSMEQLCAVLRRNLEEDSTVKNQALAIRIFKAMYEKNITQDDIRDNQLGKLLHDIKFNINNGRHSNRIDKITIKMRAAFPMRGRNSEAMMAAASCNSRTEPRKRSAPVDEEIDRKRKAP